MPPNQSKKDRNRQYLDALKGVNPFNVTNPYAEETIDQNKKFLIICEGKNTEPSYFNNFPVVSKEIITIIGGYGGSKIHMVNEAINIATKGGYVDHSVWCVFDYDVNHNNVQHKQDFDNAIIKARQAGFNVAFSNDCFELWIVLHFKLISNQHHRSEYYSMLTNQFQLPKSYESIGKEPKFARTLYHRLKPYQTIAIRNATNLKKSFNSESAFHQMNPCSTVFQLVEELNKYLRR